MNVNRVIDKIREYNTKALSGINMNKVLKTENSKEYSEARNLYNKSLIALQVIQIAIEDLKKE